MIAAVDSCSMYGTWSGRLARVGEALSLLMWALVLVARAAILALALAPLARAYQRSRGLGAGLGLAWLALALWWLPLHTLLPPEVVAAILHLLPLALALALWRHCFQGTPAIASGVEVMRLEASPPAGPDGLLGGAGDWSGLSRRELQARAKQCGVKANLPSVQIIAALAEMNSCGH
jgi:hypothetical protein